MGRQHLIAHSSSILIHWRSSRAALYPTHQHRRRDDQQHNFTLHTQLSYYWTSHVVVSLYQRTMLFSSGPPTALIIYVEGRKFGCAWIACTCAYISIAYVYRAKMRRIIMGVAMHCHRNGWATWPPLQMMGAWAQKDKAGRLAASSVLLVTSKHSSKRYEQAFHCFNFQLLVISCQPIFTPHHSLLQQIPTGLSSTLGCEGPGTYSTLRPTALQSS